MAYTKAQWDKLQSAVPRDERVPYEEYLATLSVLERMKAVEAASGIALTAIVDEQAKAAGAKTDNAAQKNITTGSGVNTNTIAGITAASNTGPTNTDTTYTTKIVKDGLTQAQIDAKAGQAGAADAQTVAKDLQEKAAKITALADRYKKGEKLTAEEYALLGIKPPTTGGADNVGKEPPNKPGAAWIVSPDGKSWIKPPQPNPTDTWDNEKGWVPAAGDSKKVKNPGYFTDPKTGLLYKDDVLVEGDYNGFKYKAGAVTGKADGNNNGDGVTKYKATDGTVFTDQAAYVQYQKMLNDKDLTAKATDAAGAAARQSAYDLLYAEFSKYGLGSLVEPLSGLIKSGASPAEFTIKLRESDAYKKRFSANQARVDKGLRAISEAEYIGLEDQYQNILRNAGLPDTYWKRGDLGMQEGFTNFIANDVSAVELEDRVSTAQQRLLYANPEVSIALKTFYPDITNGDLLAYALDPTKGLDQIKRRITAAEIGSSAVQMGLATNVTDAEYLARYGVNKAQAQQGYRTAAEVLPTASKLGDIYARQGLGPYTQQTAEQEIFNVPGAAEAAAKRKKLVGLEQASFSGKSGSAPGALARERAGNF